MTEARNKEIRPQWEHLPIPANDEGSTVAFVSRTPAEWETHQREGAKRRRVEDFFKALVDFWDAAKALARAKKAMRGDDWDGVPERIKQVKKNRRNRKAPY